MPEARDPFIEVFAQTARPKSAVTPRAKRPRSVHGSARLHVLLPAALVSKLKWLARDRRIPLTHLVAAIVDDRIRDEEQRRGSPLPLHAGPLPPGRPLT